ncbi:GNAT family N-acetyltransferase/peptidase C39 family protein [Parahaliea sp. F7430]|uniref:GNAT family N-acetyltransferase/peptidase C39 family protein n=1 Tax=Sediminihaliea albiluteola TaxID=2758564 RepID=A0A7W2TU88_9GAMM|nr:GNAT family N-acetyltransferase/peptidase C39 family protein [Sediminihaliea albiluteola]MBA6412051.1 GNAT family N-acetyltransferase/peptidase C39 family protein [Sediminihaliea albiluteola]
MIEIRPAQSKDLSALLELESSCFATDRISRRSFRRWLSHPDCVFTVALIEQQVSAYALVTLRRGTHLARLYSLAVAPSARGQGLAEKLIKASEDGARDAGSIYLRLEVASTNYAAITLYKKLGYKQFGLYEDYYEDHGPALRMEKCIHPYTPSGDSRTLPWLAQTTAFTCGPSALMMAMAGLPGDYQPSPEDEIQLWREATTVFMTSGHGGCHPLGLALAAQRRGFYAQAWINNPGPLFLDGVRDENKKRVMRIAHESFVSQCEAAALPVHYEDMDQQQVIDHFQSGANVLILISTYRMDSMKAPHWVVMSGYDDRCLYVHDPDRGDTSTASMQDEDARSALDCQHLPIARDNFNAMSRFGSSRLRSVVVISSAAKS